MTSIKYQTKIGSTLDFHVLPFESNWADTSGIYAFGRQAPRGNHEVLYVGQTNSFKTRFSNHERWPDAKRNGATHVLAALVPLQSQRDDIEATLIAEWRPPLNSQGL